MPININEPRQILEQATVVLGILYEQEPSVWCPCCPTHI